MYLASACLLTVCCCFWPVAPCRLSAPHGPGGFWNWWQVSAGTGTPSRTPSALSGHQGAPSSEKTVSNKEKHSVLILNWVKYCLFVCCLFCLLCIPSLENKPHPCDSRRAGLVPPATATLALPGAHAGTPATAHELGGRQAHGAGQEVLAARPSLRHLDHLKATVWKVAGISSWWLSQLGCLNNWTSCLGSGIINVFLERGGGWADNRAFRAKGWWASGAVALHPLIYKLLILFWSPR